MNVKALLNLVPHIDHFMKGGGEERQLHTVLAVHLSAKYYCFLPEQASINIWGNEV